MGCKRSPGLYQRNGIWHIDKRLFRYRHCESTRTRLLSEAERLLNHRIQQMREVILYGQRPKRSFREAAVYYSLTHQHKRSIRSDECYLRGLDPHIGHLSLDEIHLGVLQPFIQFRQSQGVKSLTINHQLSLVRRILTLAASEWIDEHGLTWLAQVPMIKLLPETDRRQPYPLSWDEQTNLFKALPDHSRDMALFAVNTGCRDKEVCRLQWNWEQKVPELSTSVFVIPATYVKNKAPRLVVLNKIAKEVIEKRRGQHETHVFTYRDKPIQRMLNSAWKRAREQVDLAQVRVHDLKHTFGRRLRAAGVSFEDRQDLLGHKSHRITTHYSAAELTNLITAANQVCTNDGQQVSLTLLRDVVKDHLC